MDSQKLQKGTLLNKQISDLIDDIDFLEGKNIVPEVIVRMEFPFKQFIYLENSVLSHEYLKKLYIESAKERLAVLRKEFEKL